MLSLLFHLIFSSGQVSPSLPPDRWVRSPLFFVHVVGYTYWMRQTAAELLAGHAVAGKDVSLAASALSLSHSTLAHGELRSRINHHRLELRQFSWAVRNSVTCTNSHVFITLSNCPMFVSFGHRFYFLIRSCLSPSVDMIPYTCIITNIRPNKIPFKLHYRYFVNGCFSFWCGLRECVDLYLGSLYRDHKWTFCSFCKRRMLSCVCVVVRLSFCQLSEKLPPPPAFT